MRDAGGLTYTVTGTVEEVDERTLRVTELPIRRWTDDYNEFIDSMMKSDDKNKEPFIQVQSCSY